MIRSGFSSRGRGWGEKAKAKGSFQGRGAASRLDPKEAAALKERHRERARFEGLLACFAYVAASDRLICNAEVAFVNDRLAELGVDAGASQASIATTATGQASGKILSFVAGCAPRITERRRILESLLDCGACDGPLLEVEEEAVRSVARMLRVTPDQYARILRRWEVRNGTTAGTDRSQPADDEPEGEQVPWYYQLLGCSPSDSDETIKRSYRKLALQLHPDKQIAASRNGETVATDAKDFQRLQAAYDEVRRSRRGA